MKLDLVKGGELAWRQADCVLPGVAVAEHCVMKLIKLANSDVEATLRTR